MFRIQDMGGYSEVHGYDQGWKKPRLLGKKL